MNGGICETGGDLKRGRSSISQSETFLLLIIAQRTSDLLSTSSCSSVSPDLVLRRSYNIVMGADMRVGDPLSCALLSVYVIGTTGKLSPKSNFFSCSLLVKGAYFNRAQRSAQPAEARNRNAAKPQKIQQAGFCPLSGISHPACQI